MYIFKRGNYYHLHYYDSEAGRGKRVSTGEKTQAGAIRFVSKYKEELKNCLKTKNISFTDFEAEYIKHAEQTFTLSYQKSIKLSFRRLVEFSDVEFLKDVTPRKAEKFILFIHTQAKHAANLYYRTLKAAFNKAKQWGYLEINPFADFNLPKAIRKLPEFIDEKQLEKIISKIRNPMLGKIVFTAFHTGLRQSELTNLQWASVDLDKGIITIKNNTDFTTKNKKDRSVPINKSLKKELRVLFQKRTSIYVFSKSDGFKFSQDYLTHKFKWAARDSNFSEGIHFHSLRHSFASILVQKGVSLYVVKELLGHENISTTQIYAHLDNSALVRAVNLLSE